MVAVQFPDASSNPLVRKAARLAKRHNAGVQLVHIIALPCGPYAGLDTGMRGVIEGRRTRLEKLARPLRKVGLSVDTIVSWDYPAADAIVRQVLKHKPDVLLAQSQRHKRLARAFLTNTDWELIRQCPCPVWLSKTPRLRDSGAVIAAIDPLHARAKPTELDAVILEAAKGVAGKRNGVVAAHVVELPQPIIAGDLTSPLALPVSKKDLQRLEAEAKRAVARETRGYRIAERNQIVLPGNPAVQLPRTAKRRGARLLVMGAVSRSGLRRFFIGNTAERVIDEVPCDVLVVKPRGFRPSVLQNPAMAFPQTRG